MNIKEIPIERINTKKKQIKVNETLIDLRKENEQLRKRVKELEKGLEEMLAVANIIL